MQIKQNDLLVTSKLSITLQFGYLSETCSSHVLQTSEDANNSFYRVVMAKSTEFLSWQTCHLNRKQCHMYAKWHS